MGHLRCTGETLRLPSEDAYADFLYAMYIDDTSKVTGADTRYLVGAMFHQYNKHNRFTHTCST